MSTHTYAGRFVRELERPVSVRTPTEVAAYLTGHVFVPIAAFEQEELWVLILSARHAITHTALVARGTVDSCVARPVDVFRAAVRLNAHSLVVAHNGVPVVTEPKWPLRKRPGGSKRSLSGETGLIVRGVRQSRARSWPQWPADGAQ